MAVAWTIMKCKLSLRGLQNFQIITDHSLLVSILNSHRLDKIDNPRLQHLWTKLMACSFTAIWCKGSSNMALSWHPILEPMQEDGLAECDEDSTPAPSISELRVCQSGSSTENVQLQDLRQQASQDEEYQLLKDVIMKGFPNSKGDLPELCRCYWQSHHHLTVEDDLIVHGCCLLIPHQMRRHILKQLHESHQGTVRTKQYAWLTVYWPSLNNDIDNVISHCLQCQTHLPLNAKEPIITKPCPAHPLEALAADSCHHGSQCYLIVVDC